VLFLSGVSAHTIRCICPPGLSEPREAKKNRNWPKKETCLKVNYEWFDWFMVADSKKWGKIRIACLIQTFCL
jgi:hypothetical protein